MAREHALKEGRRRAFRQVLGDLGVALLLALVLLRLDPRNLVEVRAPARASAFEWIDDEERRDTAQRRLLAAGKKPKIALTACMRKLLTILNAMLKHRTLWAPGLGATSHDFGSPALSPPLLAAPRKN